MSRVACRVSRVWWQHLFDALLFVSNVWLCVYAGVGGLSKELTVAEMDARIAFLEVDNVEKEAKLERLRTSSAGLTQAEVTKLRRKYDGAKAEWRKRKRKVRAPYRWRADDSFFLHSADWRSPLARSAARSWTKSPRAAA